MVKSCPINLWSSIWMPNGGLNTGQTFWILYIWKPDKWKLVFQMFPLFRCWLFRSPLYIRQKSLKGSFIAKLPFSSFVQSFRSHFDNTKRSCNDVDTSDVRSNFDVKPKGNNSNNIVFKQIRFSGKAVTHLLLYWDRNGENNSTFMFGTGGIWIMCLVQILVVVVAKF